MYKLIYGDKNGVYKVELQTKIGTMHVKKEDIISFPKGILGFDEYHEYVVIKQEESVFSFLQSVEEPDLSFVIIMPELVRSDYSVQLQKEDIELLQIASPDDGRVYAIVTIPENVADMTVNLQAPVVINSKRRIGMQIIVSGDTYHTKHNVIAEMQKNAFLLQKQASEEQNDSKVQESV